MVWIGQSQRGEVQVNEHAKSTAREVHALLLEANSQTHNVNLTKAAHLAETEGKPNDHFQLDTFIAIRSVQTAIENGASAAEREPLLMNAVSIALKWATARG
jgi:hypothetical protein